MALVDLPIPADEGLLAQQVLARFTELDPDLYPADGDPETIITEALATPFATAIEILRLTARGAYADIVGRVVRTSRGTSIAATAIVTLNVNTSAGVTIDAGTPFALTKDGDEVPFILPNPVVIPAMVTTVTGVAIVAADTGEDANGASNDARSTHARIATVTVTAVAGGGAEEQSEDDYVEQIERRSKRVSFAPVAAPDYAAAALDHPRVARCAYKNRYDPSAPSAETLGHVTIWPIDDDGEDLTSEEYEDVADLFNTDDQPQNTAVHVLPPPRVDIAVVITGKIAPSADPAVVEAAIEDAINQRFSGAEHDYDRDAPGLWRPTGATITNFDGVAAIDDIPDLDRITTFTLNGGSSVSLGSGPVALPNVTSISITLTSS